jgi:hypothetical protein
MKSWWMVSKRGRAHRRQTSLTQAYKKSFLDMTNASILVVTTLRSSWSMYVFLIRNKCFFLVVCFVNSSPEVTFRIALVFLYLIESFYIRQASLQWDLLFHVILCNDLVKPVKNKFLLNSA